MQPNRFGVILNKKAPQLIQATEHAKNVCCLRIDPASKIGTASVGDKSAIICFKKGDKGTIILKGTKQSCQQIIAPFGQSLWFWRKT